MGCTLYALAFYQSPFEVEETGSVALAVKNGKFSFPPDAEQKYTKQFLHLISSLLTVNNQDRPFIDEVIERVDAMLHPDAPNT
jgi:serine/threonine kinase 16